MLGGMDPRQMKKMMKQMGIDSTEIEAKRVVIETEGANIIIENPSITKINAQGQISYQISGNEKQETAVNKEDIQIVMEQANVDEKTAEDALKQKNGDIAEAILFLQENSNE
jgi:nascent polypeptide-associated complex subunit alpha